MSDLEVHYMRGIVCDVCRAEFTTGLDENNEPVLISRWGVDRTELYARAQAVGWERWLSRSTRDYCPACRPKPGHSMRRLW